MRRGLTLIEMLFSMVIIAFVFSVVPKIIFSSNKSLEVGIKEDALFNAMALTGMIAKLPWDEQNTLSDAILDTDSPSFVCDGGATGSGYRPGGFIGSRNCLGSVAAASALGQDGGGDYNDIDDYNGYSTTVTLGGASRYTLTGGVSYENEGSNPVTTSSSVTLGTGGAAGTSNLKRIRVQVDATTPKLAGFSSSYFFYSANIGQFHINKRAW